MEHQNKIIGCSEFEESLSCFLEKTLDAVAQKAVAEHALKCPLCHTLLNEVRDSVEICHTLAAPEAPMTHLEARVLSATMPSATMKCKEFETHLTDYLDGFLAAPIFHRWERHAVMCNSCSDLPGEVVRSIAACYTYKMEEYELPEGLHSRILNATIGTEAFGSVKPAWGAQIKEWIRDISFPISIPQAAPVAMMLLFIALVFSQTTSANGSLGGMYQKSFELAGQTYRTGTNLVLGEGAKSSIAEKPATSKTESGDAK